jgi:hypothetical protein
MFVPREMMIPIETGAEFENYDTNKDILWLSNIYWDNQWWFYEYISDNMMIPIKTFNGKVYIFKY